MKTAAAAAAMKTWCGQVRWSWTKKGLTHEMNGKTWCLQLKTTQNKRHCFHWNVASYYLEDITDAKPTNHSLGSFHFLREIIHEWMLFVSFWNSWTNYSTWELEKSEFWERLKNQYGILVTSIFESFKKSNQPMRKISIGKIPNEWNVTHHKSLAQIVRRTR